MATAKATWIGPGYRFVGEANDGPATPEVQAEAATEVAAAEAPDAGEPSEALENGRR